MSKTMLTVITFIFTAVLASRQNRSRQLLEYCYDDYSYTYETAGYYNSYDNTYTWQDENCPTSYDAYYSKTYICDEFSQSICEYDDEGLTVQAYYADTLTEEEAE